MPDQGVELNEDFAEIIIHKKYIYNPRCLLLALLLMFMKCLCHEVKKKFASQTKEYNFIIHNLFHTKSDVDPEW